MFNPSLTPGCCPGWGNFKFALPCDGSVTINFETSAEEVSPGTSAVMTVAEAEFDCSGILPDLGRADTGMPPLLVRSDHSCATAAWAQWLTATLFDGGLKILWLP